MKKKKKAEKNRNELWRNRWEGVDDDAEQEPAGEIREQDGGEQSPEIVDQAANFNPFDEDTFVGNVS